jgi:hypothetical protein
MLRVKLFGILVVFSMLSLNSAVWGGWLDEAAENALERTGTRAVDDAADSVYDSGKEVFKTRDDPPPVQQKQPSKPASRRDSKPAAVSEDVDPQGHSSSAVEDDDHYIQSDDYFISENELGQSTWIYVKIAKMVTPPSKKTKDQAEFFQVTDGNKIWTKYFTKTRIATERDLKLGTIVIIYENSDSGAGQMPPDSKEQARGNAWFMAKITDTSDLYKGYVTVSGNYHVNVKNLRVVKK